MSLTKSEVEKIAHLARLQVAAEKIDLYATQLSSILDFIAQMDAVETTQVAPLTHPIPNLSQRLRPDVVTEMDQHVKFQKIAPAVEAGLYLVPKVIDEA